MVARGKPHESTENLMLLYIELYILCKYYFYQICILLLSRNTKIRQYIIMNKEPIHVSIGLSIG